MKCFALMCFSKWICKTHFHYQRIINRTSGDEKVSTVLYQHHLNTAPCMKTSFHASFCNVPKLHLEDRKYSSTSILRAFYTLWRLLDNSVFEATIIRIFIRKRHIRFDLAPKEVILARCLLKTWFHTINTGGAKLEQLKMQNSISNTPHPMYIRHDENSNFDSVVLLEFFLNYMIASFSYNTFREIDIDS